MQLWTGSGDPAMDVLAFPGGDIYGTTSSPPLVDCGQHAQLGGRIYLTLPQVVDAVHVARESFSDAEREALAANLGCLSPSETEEVREELLRLREENANLTAALEQPWAEVFDFAKEKARIELAREQAQTQEPVA